jgi:3-oxoacyl-[acyl-carrier-protein] synthase-3
MRVWDISRKPYISRDIFKSGAMWMEMDGPAVFKHAVMSLTEVAENSIKRSGVKPEDIKYVIPHQANQRINLMVAERLRFPPEKFLSNIQKYGNTSAASIPLLLDQTYRAGMLERGDLLLLLGFGSGFTWASTLLRW